MWDEFDSPICLCGHGSTPASNEEIDRGMATRAIEDLERRRAVRDEAIDASLPPPAEGVSDLF